MYKKEIIQNPFYFCFFPQNKTKFKLKKTYFIKRNINDGFVSCSIHPSYNIQITSVYFCFSFIKLRHYHIPWPTLSSLGRKKKERI